MSTHVEALVSAAVFAYSWGSSAAFGAEIQGRVLDAQGEPVRGSAVTVSRSHGVTQAKVITAADGSFSIANLEPGVYSVTVSLANGQETLRRDVAVGNDSDRARADFRFTVAAAKGVAGLEERNPNIFIYRIDLNDLRNLLTLFRGPNPTYIPEFLAEDNIPRGPCSRGYRFGSGSRGTRDEEGSRCGQATASPSALSFR